MQLKFKLNEKALKFIVISSKSDLLAVIERQFRTQGIIGVTGMQGEFIFVVDGRWGGQLAAKRITQIKNKILKANEMDFREELTQAVVLVDQILKRFIFRPHLQGYMLLRQALINIYLEEDLPTPLSKTVFPNVAEIFRLSSNQVERNLRYLFEKLAEDESVWKIQKEDPEKRNKYFGFAKDTYKDVLFETGENYSIRSCLSRLSQLLFDAKRARLQAEEEALKNKQERPELYLRNDAEAQLNVADEPLEIKDQQTVFTCVYCKGKIDKKPM